jgi:hypothetical protein
MFYCVNLYRPLLSDSEPKECLDSEEQRDMDDDDPTEIYPWSNWREEGI